MFGCVYLYVCIYTNINIYMYCVYIYIYVGGGYMRKHVHKYLKCLYANIWLCK